MDHKRRKGVLSDVVKLAEEIREDLDLILVDTQFVKEHGRRILRFIINKEGGVTLSDCEAFSRAVSVRLDEEDIIEERYFLEVSSPGI